MKTFISHDFPFNLTNDQLSNEYNSISLLSFGNCSDVIKALLHKLSVVRNYQLRNKLPTSMSVDEHFALYYPTSEDVSGLALLMMLQAGWNKETVMNIDEDNYEHWLTATVEERVKIVWSEKFRSQGNDVPYDAPKRMLARSDAQDPYSLYNLISLAKDLSAPIASHVFGVVDDFRNRPVNSLFAYVRTWKAWPRGTPLGTLDYRGNFAAEVNKLLSRHIVIDNGVRLTTAQSLTRRLRATWMFYNSDDTPFSLLSQLMGHSSRDTTDKHYDNSALARAKRYKRLREVLEHIVALLRARKFSGMLSKEAQALSKPKLTAFYLPNFDRALWACKNRQKPTWPSAPNLPAGVQCSTLDKCIFCSQLWVLKDSLPYLLERLAHIDELLRDYKVSDFGSELEAEQEAIERILERWGDEGAINEAIRYRSANTPLLPREMRDLKLIFKTGDLDA